LPLCNGRLSALSEPGRGYYPFIDGLRAVAVLGVILFHYNLLHVSGGYVGVDVFFVLSGFLITGLIESKLRRGIFSFAEFYERRCRRIIPALFITGVVCTMAAIVLLVPRDFREFSKSLKGAAFFYSNVVFADSAGYFAAPAATKPLLHTWSLAVEEQFYLIFPPVLYGWHKALRGNRAFLCFAVGVIGAASFVLSLVLMQINSDGAFYLLPPRAWELLSGSLTALALVRIRLPRAAAEAIAVLAALGLGLSFVCYDRQTPFPGLAAALPCACAMLLIWTNVSSPTFIGRILSARPLVAIGLISYGLYLYHWPVLAFSRYFFDRELSIGAAAVALAATFSISVLSYRLVELPIRSGAWVQRRKTIFNLSAIGLLGIGAIGIVGVNAGGFPSRFSGAALQYASGAHDTWDWNRCMPAPDRLNDQTICRIGAPGNIAPSFLLWGDSHAAALEPAVDARAKAFNAPGWYVGYSRCPALIGAAPIQHTPDDHPCLLIADTVFDLVRRNGIKHVVLASRWDSYIDGWDPRGNETKQDLTISFDTVDGRFTGQEAFQHALRETLKRFRNLGVDVWIIEEVPPQLVDIPSALAKAIAFGRDPLLLRRPFKDIEERRRAAATVFAEYVGAPGVFFIDPAKIFCPNKTPCLISESGHALYSDGNHLSVFGALWSQFMLDPFFNSLPAASSLAVSRNHGLTALP
jgi:peptidoglycan/LPS O-acetylase OafA/YrhL